MPKMKAAIQVARVPRSPDSDLGLGLGTAAAIITASGPLALAGHGCPVVPAVHAHRVWHGFDSRNSIVASLPSSQDPATCFAGGVKFGVPSFYLTTPIASRYKRCCTRTRSRAVVPLILHEATGSTGNLAVSFLSSPDGAPLFLVHNGQLLHHANESHILYVNVLTATRDSDTPGSLPYRLTLQIDVMAS